MADPPVGLGTKCPSCGNSAQAIVPERSKLVEEEEDADGKVWVTCRECGEKFIAYYRFR